MNEGHYALRAGFSMDAADVAAIGTELLAIDNLPLAQAVQYIRRRPEMALYQKLIWHDFTAADLYRQEQVKYYRNAICLVERTREGQEVVRKSFAATAPLRPHPHHLLETGARKRKPKPKASPLVLCDAGERLERAKLALHRFLQVYCPYRACLSELDARMEAVFAAIDALDE